MRTVLSVVTAVLVLVAGAVHAKNLSVDLDMKKPVVSTKEAQADEWFNKGNAAYQAKNYDEAIACYKKASEIDPSFASAFYNLGIIYEAKGMTDAAISSYKQVLAIKPDYYAAQNNLGTIYKKKGMIDEAMTEFKQILSKNFNFPYAHFNLAECYFSKGNMHSASEHYYKAGLFFVERGDKAWAQKSYDALKQTNAQPDKVQALLEKMNEAAKAEPAAINQVIEVSPKAH